MTVHTLLLVPPPGDTTLLADEAGGGRVPRMESGTKCAYTDHRRWRVPGDHPDPHCYMCDPLDAALLLVHNGAPVAMGCDRLARVFHVLLYTGYSAAWAQDMAARFVQSNPDVRVIALDADGREVAGG